MPRRVHREQHRGAHREQHRGVRREKHRGVRREKHRGKYGGTRPRQVPAVEVPWHPPTPRPQVAAAPHARNWPRCRGSWTGAAVAPGLAGERPGRAGATGRRRARARPSRLRRWRHQNGHRPGVWRRSRRKGRAPSSRGSRARSWQGGRRGRAAGRCGRGTAAATANTGAAGSRRRRTRGGRRTAGGATGSWFARPSAVAGHRNPQGA
eukprot:scaffold3201_cov116-Isochrysis_galbana.AAC.10